MSSSIQFRGMDAVISAYESRNVPSWSLWQGRQFLFPYAAASIEEGLQQLEKTLEILAESSNAIYTLKVYEDIPKGGKIKSNTPDDGSFNFRLNEETQLITQNQYASMRNNKELENRLARIEEFIVSKESEEEEEAEEPNKLGLVGEIIGHPSIQPVIVDLLTNLVAGMKNPALPSQMAVPAGAAINGVNEDKMLTDALAILKKHDNRLPEHLAKLAKIAAENPPTFQFLIQTIDSM